MSNFRDVGPFTGSLRLMGAAGVLFGSGEFALICRLRGGGSVAVRTAKTQPAVHGV
jgi:hypothetical protein